MIFPSKFSRFLANFSLSGVALCPPWPPSGYATVVLGIFMPYLVENPMKIGWLVPGMQGWNFTFSWLYLKISIC